MTSTTIVQPADRLVRRLPPLFMLVCIAMWISMLLLAFHDGLQSTDVGMLLDVAAP